MTVARCHVCYARLSGSVHICSAPPTPVRPRSTPTPQRATRPAPRPRSAPQTAYTHPYSPEVIRDAQAAAGQAWLARAGDVVVPSLRSLTLAAEAVGSGDAEGARYHLRTVSKLLDHVMGYSEMVSDDSEVMEVA